MLKCGLSLYINSLIRQGYITALATTGSATVHDLELAFYGKTSEDVAVEAPPATGSDTRKAWVRGGIFALGLLIVASVGAQLETASPSGMGLAARFIWNALVLGAFVLAFRGHKVLQERGLNDGLAWTVALSALVVVGMTMERILPLLA